MSANGERAAAFTPAPPQFYGVAPTTALTPGDYERLARARIGTTRIVFNWSAIGPDPWADSSQWYNADGSVIHATAAGVRLLPTLIGAPSRISEDPFRPPLDTPAERQQWQQFVRAAVERYGPGGDFWDFVRACPPDPGHCRPDIPYRPITTWQVWNEPNLGIFWQPSPDPYAYAELVRLTADAIHSVDPSATVVTGGLPRAKGGENAIPQNSFLSSFYQVPGIANSFDGVGLNPYRRKPRAVKRLIGNARKIIRGHGDGETPIWITEVGWSTNGPGDEPLVTSDHGQASRLRRTMKMLTRERDRLGIALASWFTYQDSWSETYCAWCRGAGLFNRKGKPKPAWKRYLKVTGGRR